VRCVASLLLILVFSGSVVGFNTSLPTSAAQEIATSCKLETLPSDVQGQLKEDLGSWKIEEPDDLGRNARERWGGERPLQCPGIAMGQFENNESQVYAILLVHRTRGVAGHKFLVFSSKTGSVAHVKRILDQSNDLAAGNAFIRKMAIGRFFDAASKRKFNALARDVILFVDSGENEYEADVFFWAKGNYEQRPVDY
jgi:hypothetical protein